MKRFIKAKDIVVHFECCECKATFTEILSETFIMSSTICDECDNMENFIEVIGVTIDKK